MLNCKSFYVYLFMTSGPKAQTSASSRSFQMSKKGGEGWHLQLQTGGSEHAWSSLVKNDYKHVVVLVYKKFLSASSSKQNKSKQL